MPTRIIKNFRARTRHRSDRYIMPGVALLLALILGNAFVTQRNMARLARSYDHVVRAYEILDALNNVFSGVQDAETANRGFFITGQESYLAPYYKAEKTIPHSLTTLKNLVKSSNVPRLENEIEARMALIRARIRERRVRGRVALLEPQNTGLGKRRMDSIRRLVASMRGAEYSKLNKHITESRATLQRTVTNFWLVTLASLFSLLTIGYLVRRDQGEQKLYESSLLAATEFAEREKARAEEEKARAEDEKRNAEYSRDEAERANSAKSEFISGVSHELRTPLNAVIGFSKLLQNPRVGELNEDQHAYLGDIVNSAEHLLQLINDILDISKIEAGKMTLDAAPFDLAELLHQSLAIVREKARQNNLTLRVELPDDIRMMPLLVADRRKIKQVLFNLLSNAVKFTPEGGFVELTAQRGLAKGAPLQPQEPDTFITVCVRDTGIGIAPENQERIFAAFEQVDNSQTKQFQGTGLGLALSRRMIELHGGALWLQSEEGKGSTFCFALPLRPADVTNSESLSTQQEEQSP